MLGKFQWLTRGVELPEIDFGRVERWLEAVADSYGKILGPMNYIFCSDDEILKVNIEFLQHDYFTDIITFDYSRRKLVSGDIFISLDTVRSNSELVGATYDAELHRVIVHGLLHLCGINDKGPGEREIMEDNEDKALTLLESLKN